MIKIKKILFCSRWEDQRYIPDTTNKSHSERLTNIYKLWKSQFIFSVAKHVVGDVFHIFSGSSISSQVISDTMKGKKSKYIKIIKCSSS